MGPGKSPVLTQFDLVLGKENRVELNWVSVASSNYKIEMYMSLVGSFQSAF